MKLNFSEIWGISPGLRRTAALAQWVQELYPGDKDLPVLVGGGAVELFTRGAYVTGDLDFVGLVPPSVATALRLAGFTKEGRHWFHEEGRIFLEFPSAVLGTEEEARERVFNDCRVLIISPEDLIVDRLSAWVHWRSALDGVNAFLLYRAVKGEMDLKRLEMRSSSEKVQAALNSVRELYTSNEGAIPGGKVMEAWAKKGPL